jgi:hypothetical protein
LISLAAGRRGHQADYFHAVLEEAKNPENMAKLIS